MNAETDHYFCLLFSYLNKSSEGIAIRPDSVIVSDRLMDVLFSVLSQFPCSNSSLITTNKKKRSLVIDNKMGVIDLR